MSHDRQLIRVHSTNLFTAYINQQSACSEYAQKVVCRFAQTNIIAHSEVVDHLKKQLFHLDNFIGHKMIND